MRPIISFEKLRLETGRPSLSAISYILKNFYSVKKIKLYADVHSLDFEPEYE